VKGYDYVEHATGLTKLNFGEQISQAFGFNFIGHGAAHLEAVELF
jgi:methyl coenzyme M reductase beta subunit